MSQDCIFCKIAGGDVPATVVHETANTTAFEDLNPQAPVHVLIIPRTHIETVNDLETAQTALIGSPPPKRATKDRSSTRGEVTKTLPADRRARGRAG